MNKTDDDELGDEELSDEEIKALSEGLHLNCIFYGLILFQSYTSFCLIYRQITSTKGIRVKC